MNLGEQKKYLDFISEKEVSGETFTQPEYNLNLPIVVLEEYEELINKWKETQDITEDLLPYMVVMGGLTEMPLTINSNGHGTLPTDFAHHISLGRSVTEDGVTTYHSIDITTAAQWDYNRGSYLTPATNKYPKAIYRNGYIEFRPIDLKYVEFSYYQLPETPFYDYCISDDDEEFYMPVGSSIDVAAGTLTSSTGVILATDVTHLTATSYPYTSVSVEMKFGNNVKDIAIVLRLLSKIGISLKEYQLIQYAEQMQLKEKQRNDQR